MESELGNKESAAVTGGTGAIGSAIALQLAAQGYSVILIARNENKSQRVVEEISKKTGNLNVGYKIADLSSQNSIQNLSAEWNGPLDILINNAAAVPFTRTETQAGIEVQFATNILGYFWMMEYFKDILGTSSGSRIVNVASYWAGDLDLDDLEFVQRPYHNHTAYRQSKQADRMLTAVFADKLKGLGITVNSCHPGDVPSNLSKQLGFGGSQTPADGARTPVWLATSPTLDQITGRYFENQEERPCQFADLKSESSRLYEICQSY